MSIRPALATWGFSLPMAASFSPRRSGIARLRTDLSNRVSLRLSSRTRVCRGVTAFTKRSSRIRIAMSCCKKFASSRCGGNCRIITFMPYCLRIWPIAATATPAGSATTRAIPCFLPNATKSRWRWHRRRRGERDQSGSLASRMAGRTSRNIFRWSGNTPGRKTATSLSPEKSISKPARESLFWLSASA